MDRIVSLLGRERIECLLADREFGNSKLLKLLKINKIKYCIRLRENLYMRKDGDNEGRMLRDILSSLRVGERIVLKNAYLTRGNGKVHIFATRRI